MAEFSPNAAGRVARATREVERRMQNAPGHRGRWFRASGDILVRCCLAENHPGRGLPFDVHLGTWNATDDQWDYSIETVTAIDFHYDVPYPDAGATGLFVARSSATYGVILECVTLDCSSPGTCSTS